MEKLIRRIDTFSQALHTFEESIDLHKKYTDKEKALFLATRDSMVQRFEYCTDLLWKLLKSFLEDFEKVTLETVSPRGIIRQSVKSRILSEAEGEECLTMIQKRNETSHIYHEEVAEDIAAVIPSFYKLMCLVLQRVRNKVT